MITAIIIIAILIVFIIGFIQVYKRHSNVIKKVDFASEYRNKFMEFANKYFGDQSQWNHEKKIDSELYVWLTMNVTKIQGSLGSLGVMDYMAPFQAYKVSNYPIIINTIPKFRDGNVTGFDVNSTDDCLLRYMGFLDDHIKETAKNLRNPIVWFREGFREVLSVPIFLLNWFGIISTNTVNSIKNSLIYKVVAGLIALVALLSGIVTIVVGYDQTMQFINRVLQK